MIQHCGYCGFHGAMVFVHSHYQCPVCHNNIMPCCEGEFADDPAQEEKALLEDQNPVSEADAWVGFDDLQDDDESWTDDDDFPLSPEDTDIDSSPLKWFTPVFENADDSFKTTDESFAKEENDNREVDDPDTEETNTNDTPAVDETGEIENDVPKPDDKGQYRLF